MNTKTITAQHLAIEWLYDQREDELRYAYFSRPDLAQLNATHMQSAADFIGRPDAWSTVKKPHKHDVARYYVSKSWRSTCHAS